MNCCSLKPDGIELSVYVQPKSSRNCVSGLHGGAVKIAVTAPPIEGKANAAVIKFLAGAFGVPKSKISIIRGKQSRNKTVFIPGEKPESLLATLETLVP